MYIYPRVIKEMGKMFEIVGCYIYAYNSVANISNRKIRKETFSASVLT